MWLKLPGGKNCVNPVMSLVVVFFSVVGCNSSGSSQSWVALCSWPCLRCTSHSSPMLQKLVLWFTVYRWRCNRRTDITRNRKGINFPGDCAINNFKHKCFRETVRVETMGVAHKYRCWEHKHCCWDFTLLLKALKDRPTCQTYQTSPRV